MFNPSRDQVRAFFFEAWRKHRERLPLAGAEAVAADVIERHPEYHAILEDPERYGGTEWAPEGGQTNPFLHLAMHLTLEEQISIDQPPGVRAAYTRLAARAGGHEAHHAMMECLGEMLWASQRSGLPPDGATYVACVERRASG